MVDLVMERVSFFVEKAELFGTIRFGRKKPEVCFTGGSASAD
jgi:hypothetical protein